MSLQSVEIRLGVIARTRVSVHTPNSFVTTMTSLFTWIDHSESDRRKMLDVIDLFREQGTRDELGLSVIRDGFADLLFPGTGSLQTRPRYFLFVPWMYRHLERERVRSSEIARRARAFEVRLIDAIVESGDSEGTIGVRARATLQRMPSSIYWTGLRRLGILRFQGSQDDYYRSLDEWYRRSSRAQRTDDGELVDRLRPNWHHELPEAPEGFEALARGRTVALSLSLEECEAEYLKEQIDNSVGDSIFAWCLDRIEKKPQVSFAWDHPAAEYLPLNLKRQLSHARAFSELMAGAPLLYNGMVFEDLPLREKQFVEVRQKFNDWFTLIRSREEELNDWDRADFWLQVSESGTRPSAAASAFVHSWSDLVRSASGADALWASPEARNLIRNRELGLKKGLARLGPNNQHARETLSGLVGTSRMDFRWRDAVQIYNDILRARRRT
jgi:hypothetical protein